MRQMTIFDYLPSELETTPRETIVEMISNALGLKFKYNERFEDYSTKLNGFTISFEFLRYDTIGENDGDLFIGVGIEDNHGGFGCPCDSIEEAIERLKAGMKNRDLLREPKGETNEVHYSG